VKIAAPPQFRGVCKHNTQMKHAHISTFTQTHIHVYVVRMHMDTLHAHAYILTDTNACSHTDRPTDIQTVTHMYTCTHVHM
jgi:hypothetical protein